MNKIDIYFRSQITKSKTALSEIFSDKYFQDSVVKNILIFSSLSLLVVWGLAFFYFRINTYLVPVRYNSFFGVTSLGSWYDLYRFPIFFTLIMILNTFLSRAIYKKEKLVSYILTATTFFIALITIILIVNFGKIIGA